MSWSEDSLHRWLQRRPRAPGTVGAPGHDGAVLRAASERPVLCCDQTIEGVHYRAPGAGRRVGHKAAARVLSDLAACAATPRGLLLAVSAPATTDERWLRALIEGADGLGRAVGAPVVGGDLACRAGVVQVSVTGFGVVPAGEKPVSRARARAGQAVLLTGPVGGSGLGRHLRIEPRVDAGRWLARRGATALMDVSDGLAWDLYRLGRSAGVAVELDEVPLHKDARRAARASGKSALWHGLHDGEDHELIATVPQRDVERILRAARTRFPQLARIGYIRRGAGLTYWEEGVRRAWTGGGYRHGA